MPQSVAAYGGPASVPKIGTNFTRVIASREATEWGFTQTIGEDPHPSTVVRDKSERGERIGEVYTRMLHTDPVLAGLTEKRTKAVVGLPWDVIPADESDEAIRIRDFVYWTLQRIANIEANLAHQLGAVYMGVAFDELLWAKQPDSSEWAGMWTVEQIIDRPMWRFAFKNGILHVRQKDGTLAPVPPGRILHTCHGTKDDPWGKALLDDVYWFQWLSLHVWKYWGVAVEKWAQPTVAVTYARNPDGTTVNANVSSEALSIASAIQTEFAIALPSDIEVELKEAQRSGNMSYENFAAYLDRAKALVLLGEPDTSGMSKGPGSYAKNRVANEVRYETILADATELANSLTDGLIAPLVRVNFGLDAPVPYWQFDVEEASDREARQASSQWIFEKGYAVPKAFMYRLHGVPQPKPGQATMRGPWVPSSPRPPGMDPRAPAPPKPTVPDWDEQEVA